jgi:hypothetical protein
LPENGWPVESSVYGYEDIPTLIDSLIDETKDEEDTNEFGEEKPAL